MYKRSLFLLGWCILFMACSGPLDQQQPSPAKQSPVGQIGPITLQAPDGLEIAATIHSLGETTIVLIHGWMCDQSYWDSQVPALAEQFAVVTIDLAGHGRSGTNRQNWTISSLGGDIADAIRQLDLDDVILVGHSMGGRVALEVARLMPSSVVGVIGVDTLHTSEDATDPEEINALLESFQQDFVNTCDPFVRSMFTAGASPDLIDHVATDMCSGPGNVGIALLRDYIHYDVADALENANVPIRCVNADKWPTTIEANREYADFNAIILVGYGHFLMQEASDELNVALINTIESLSEISSPFIQQ